MNLAFDIAVFYTIWWVVLFAVLPFGVRSHAETGTEHQVGTDAGSPIAIRMGMKLLVTTGITAVLFAAIYAFIAYES
jgi:predicted secreted protein